APGEYNVESATQEPPILLETDRQRRLTTGPGIFGDKGIVLEIKLCGLVQNRTTIHVSSRFIRGIPVKMFSLGTLAIALLISMSGVSEADSACDIPNNRALTTTDPTRFLLPAPKEVQEFKETCRVSIHTRVIKKKIETWDGFFDPPRDL